MTLTTEYMSYTDSGWEATIVTTKGFLRKKLHTMPLKEADDSDTWYDTATNESFNPASASPDPRHIAHLLAKLPKAERTWNYYQVSL